ncbi:MAG: CRISPR-associated protein Csx3 [Crocosphaera sp.]|nr:CRISPR-associated protein Csx3 [Crocosphaera sp.]
MLRLQQTSSPNTKKLVIKKPDNQLLSGDTLKKLDYPNISNPNVGLIIDGVAPNWLCSYLAIKYQHLAWIGCYYPPTKGVIIVSTNGLEYRVGSVSESDKNNQKEPRGLLNLKITERINTKGDSLQCLDINIREGQISFEILTNLKLPKNLDKSRGILLWGQAPVWLYVFLTLRCQSLFFPWIACYNQKTSEAIVIHCLNNQYEIGEQLGLIPPFKAPSPTIVMGGPPESGKSVLAYTLKQTLLKNGFNNQVYLHRVAWDGEGDWFAQMIKDNKDLAIQLSYNAGRAIKPKDLSQYFSKQAQLINKMRYYTNLVLLDFGGKPGEYDHLLLDSCTHYILISSSPEKNQEWHNFFQQKNLTPLAVIDSVLSNECEVVRTEPYLHICAGLWEYEQAVIPSVLLENIKGLLAHY